VGLRSLSPTAIAPVAIKRARSLRRGMTKGERRFWSELTQFRRLYDIHVRRQAPIGHYVVDFVVHARSLVIEIDVEHHFMPEQMLRDGRRGDLDYNFDGCIEEVLRELGLT